MGDEGLAQYAEAWEKQQTARPGAAKSAAVDTERLATMLVQLLDRQQLLDLMQHLRDTLGAAGQFSSAGSFAETDARLRD